jgi:hypothetical protein
MVFMFKRGKTETKQMINKCSTSLRTGCRVLERGECNGKQYSNREQIGDSDM